MCSNSFSPIVTGDKPYIQAEKEALRATAVTFLAFSRDNALSLRTGWVAMEEDSRSYTQRGPGDTSRSPVNLSGSLLLTEFWIYRQGDFWWELQPVGQYWETTRCLLQGIGNSIGWKGWVQTSLCLIQYYFWLSVCVDVLFCVIIWESFSGNVLGVFIFCSQGVFYLYFKWWATASAANDSYSNLKFTSYNARTMEIVDIDDSMLSVCSIRLTITFGMDTFHSGYFYRETTTKHWNRYFREEILYHAIWRLFLSSYQACSVHVQRLQTPVDHCIFPSNRAISHFVVVLL